MLFPFLTSILTFSPPFGVFPLVGLGLFLPKVGDPEVRTMLNGDEERKVAFLTVSASFNLVLREVENC